MTNDELIEELQKLPPGTEVTINNGSQYLDRLNDIEIGAIKGEKGPVAILTLEGTSPFEDTMSKDSEGRTIYKRIE
jgi:hypothetical protein